MSAPIPNKEQVYDERIAPLMSQIIDICKERKIAMVASFSIPNDDDQGLHCTTALTMPEYEPSDALRAAVRELFIRRGPSLLAMTVTTAPKGGQA